MHAIFSILKQKPMKRAYFLQFPLAAKAILPGGLYFYEVWDGQERLMKGKLSKMN